MKNIFIILLAILSVTCYAQYPDSTDLTVKYSSLFTSYNGNKAVMNFDEETYILSEGFASLVIDMSKWYPAMDSANIVVTSSSSSNEFVVIVFPHTDKNCYISEAGLGRSTATVALNDGVIYETKIFDVYVNNVNNAPMVVTFIPDQNLSQGFGTHLMDVHGVFIDPDGDNVTLSIGSGDTDVCTVGVTQEGALTITEGTQTGTSVITLTGSDGVLSTSTYFNVNVN